MELIPIQQINDQFLSYKDLRSAKKWISANGLKLISIGRGQFIDKSSFVKLIQSLAGADKIIQVQAIKFKGAEQEIFTDLRQKIAEL